MDTLSKDDVEIRRRVQDITRKVTVLRVNEKALTRRYTGLQDINAIQTKVNSINEVCINIYASLY